MPQKTQYSILIADDHALIRRGLKKWIESLPGVIVCGEATTGVQTIEKIGQEEPDLVLLDLNFPDMSCLEALRQVRIRFPDRDVLVLTMWDAINAARQAFIMGARGYVLKSDDPDVLLDAIETIRKGSLYYTPSIVNPRLDLGRRGVYTEFLTARETEVLTALADGNSSKQVAEKLKISVRTVETHRVHIMGKLQLDSFADLIRYALRTGMTSFIT